VKNKWYRPVLYILSTYILHPFLLLLPRVVVLQFANIFGICAFYILRKEREKALSNLTYAFGDSYDDQSRLRLIKRLFVNLSMTACDFALFPKLTLKNINELVNVDGFNRVDDIVNRRKQGLIVITAHLGNWELIASTFVRLGYKGLVLGKKIYYSGYNKIIVDLRESQGVYTFYRSSPPKEILRRLKAGEVLGVLPDQDIDDVEGIFIDFFGKPAYTPIGPAKMSLAAKVPIMLAFMVRQGKRYNLIFDDIIEPVIYENEDKRSAIERITRTWSNIVERYIRMYPDQWVWMHNRWKTKNNKVGV